MPDVTVYSTQTCPYCHQVKQYLSQRGVSFRDADVSRDQSAAAEMVSISGQRGVPVTVIDGKVVVGFDRPLLDDLLAEAKRPKLGAAVADATKMAAQGRTQVAQGAFVGSVRSGGAAEKAGLRPGDVIISLAGYTVNSAIQLEQLVARIQPGQQVPMIYIHAGAESSGTLDFS